MIKKIIQFKLNFLARIYLKRYKPKIVVVTGNSGKTSTKEAIGAVLRSTKRIRMAIGNLNNEFGVPLSILGVGSEDYYNNGPNVLFWTKVIFLGFLRIIYDRHAPEILVLEYGADKPGDIKKLSNIYKPYVSIVSAIGEIPVHVEYFSSPEALVKEKSKLVEALNAEDYAVLNFDDKVVYDMHSKTKARIMSFGFGDGATIRVSDFDFSLNETGEPLGVVFKLNYKEHSFVPVKIDGSLGKSQAWSSSAATCVGLIFGMNLVQISEALGQYHGSAGRLRVLKGIKGSWIIDDTYNASPLSTHLALDTLRDLPGIRKIVVLGDMLELGEYVEQAHMEAGNKAARSADVLIFVGPRMKFAAEAARNEMSAENIYIFPDSNSAKLKVQEIIKENDIILVKGSQSMRMEKIVEEIMAEPQHKNELLVRQDKKWLSK